MPHLELERASTSREVLWYDCMTGTRYYLNIRTGKMRKVHPSPVLTHTRLSLAASVDTVISSAQSLRRVSSRVFDRAEAAIHGSGEPRAIHPNDPDITRERLAGAIVIRQIDRKVILVACRPTTLAQQDRTQLILIDQHAADERVRLERLMSDLINKTEGSRVQLEQRWTWQISTPDADRLYASAAWFALFGIEIEVTVLRADPAIKRVEVLFLPACIYERVWEDPRLVLLMLKQDSLLRAGALRADPPPTIAAAIAAAPPSLLEMMKSQACRSAIMFNDWLSDDKCRELLRGLAACENPFRCAHNRPTMVRVGGGSSAAWAEDMVGLGL